MHSVEDLVQFLLDCGIDVRNGRVRKSDVPKIFRVLGESQAMAPAVDENFDFGLDRSIRNRTEHDLLMPGAEAIRKVGNLTLYSNTDKNVVFLAMNGTLYYLVEYEFGKVQRYSSITQVRVWRSVKPVMNMANIEGKSVTSWVFFNILLNWADCIVTDDVQSKFGQRFWLARVEEAFEAGLRVFLIDKGTITKEYVSIRDFQEGRDEDHIWETSDKLVAISEKGML